MNALNLPLTGQLKIILLVYFFLNHRFDLLLFQLRIFWIQFPSAKTVVGRKILFPY